MRKLFNPVFQFLSMPAWRCGAAVCALISCVASMVAIAAIYAAAPESHTGTTPQAISPANSWWPRAIIIAFERRVPENLNSNAGALLRSLRQGVISELKGGVQLRTGDWVFVFADGLSREDFACLSSGSRCQSGLARLSWNRADAPRLFFAQMLQLPVRSNPSKALRASGPAGEQFVRLRFNGDFDALDCLIRREITAPMTRGYAADSLCPAEEDGIDPDQARAISRVEVSRFTQVAAVLRETARSGPVSGVMAVDALLKEKTYDRDSEMAGIRNDFGPLTASVFRYYENGTFEYTEENRSRPRALPGGPQISVRDIRSRTTTDLSKKISNHPALLGATIGTSHREFNEDLVIARDYPNGPWRPELDSLGVTLELASHEGQLLAAHLQTEGAVAAGVTGSGVEGRVALGSPAVNAEYRHLLASPPVSPIRLEMNIQAIIAGKGAPAEFPPIPLVVPITRSIRMEQLPATTALIWIAAVGGTAVLVCFLLFVNDLRPAAISLGHRPAVVEWHLPGEQTTAVVEITGYPDRLSRALWKTESDVRLTWNFLTPGLLKLRDGAKPLSVAWGGKDIEEGQPDEQPCVWKPGTKKKPGCLTRLRVRLDPAALDTSALTEPARVMCGVSIHIEMSSRAVRSRTLPGWCLPLKLAPTDYTESIVAFIDVREEPANVTFEGGNTSLHRTLGFLQREGRFGRVTLRNLPLHGGIARDVEYEAAFEAPKNAPFEVTLGNEHERLAKGTLTSSAEVSMDLWLRNPSGRLEPGAVTGAVVAKLRTAGRPSSSKRLPISMRWVPAGAVPAGLDIGTSGTRLFVAGLSSSPFIDEPVKFPAAVINSGDPDLLEEFPSLVRILDGKVERAGSGQFGCASGQGRLVESPKAELLRGLNGNQTQAKADMECYVEALGRMWRSIRDRHKIGNTVFVVTVPWPYPQPLVQWYCDVVKKHFDGSQTVTPVREAHAAAYYKLILDAVTAGSSAHRQAQEGSLKTLVVDAGAGTIDFAVIESQLKGGRAVEMEMRGHTFSVAAGNVYDERMLETVFGFADGAATMAEDPHARANVRRFKEHHLENLLDGKVPERQLFELTGVERSQPLVRSREQFMAMMKPYFKVAFIEPLKRLAAVQDCRQIDQVVLSGRGLQAVGCREEVMRLVRALFLPVQKSARISELSILPGDRAGAIARGALTYGRGEVLIRDGDRVASRDVTLIVDLGEGPLDSRTLVQSGNLPREIHDLVFKRAVRMAWIIAGGSPLTPHNRELISARVRLGQPPGENAVVLASTAPGPGTRRLIIHVASDGEAGFVTLPDGPDAGGSA